MRGVDAVELCGQPTLSIYGHWSIATKIVKEPILFYTTSPFARRGFFFAQKKLDISPLLPYLC
jgi:hypothetical protein